MRSARRRGNEHLDGLADELGGLPAENLGRAPVGAIDQSVAPNHQGGVGSSLQQQPLLFRRTHGQVSQEKVLLRHEW
ncbi:unannotated protein [freshwater metagenome]|uniref:Unannotated protein n=1 Tax=freshwater metagenome TaxID=449393 RepID=A0A6J6Z368_9ZZZZ